MFRGTEVSLSGTGGPLRLGAALVTADFFRTLRVAPVRGRGFQLDEDQPGRDLVAVLGHNLWLTRFGGDPSVIGRSIPVEGKSFTVVGIAPAGFRYPDASGAVAAGLSRLTRHTRKPGTARLFRDRPAAPSATLPQARAAYGAHR